MAISLKNTSGIYIFLILQAGCGSGSGIPDMGGIYSELAKEEDPDRNPVIVIPGVLGSTLIDSKSGVVAWGKIGRGLENPKKDDEKRRIALPMEPGKNIVELKDEILVGEALEKIVIKMYGVTVAINTYADILAILGAGGFHSESKGSKKPVDYGDRHFSSFQFAYDWRRDLVEAARELHAYILEKRHYVQEQIAERHGIHNKDVRFNVIAHSMGGLVVRYYLRYGTAELPDDGSLPPLTWNGGRYIEKAVLIATPNGGSIDSFRHLVEGTRLGPGLPSFDAAILGTMPAIYQLLPRMRHGHLISGNEEHHELLDPHDPELWIQMKWGLADPGRDTTLQILLPDIDDRETRSRIAIDHLRKSLFRARAFAAALDVPATPPPGLSISLIAGDAVATTDVISVNTMTGKLETYKKSPGDGTVLRSSALMDERTGSVRKGRLVTPVNWSNVLFLFSDHLGLTKDPVFVDNILFTLLEQPLEY